MLRTLMRINGAWGHFGPSRLMKTMVKDRAALRRSIDALLDWDFDRIVLSHGDIVEAEGKNALRTAFAWLK